MATEFKRIEVRAGSPGAWAAANPVLTYGEPGAEITVGGQVRLKIGDGVTAWNDLQYATGDLDGKVDITGDTMTGNLTIQRDGAVTSLILDSDPGQQAEFAILSDGVYQWVIRSAGGDLEICRFDAGGGFLGPAVSVDDATGSVNVPAGITTATPGLADDSTRAATTEWVRDVAITKLTATATLDFPSTGSSSSSELTVNVPGAVVGDVVALGPPTNLPADYVALGWVSAANTVTVRLLRTSSAINPDPGSWKIMVLK